MRPEKGQQCKWNSGLYGIIIIIIFIIIEFVYCVTVVKDFHSIQMQAAVSASLVRKQRFRVHFDQLVPVMFKVAPHEAAASSHVQGCQDVYHVSLAFASYLIWQPL